MSSPKVRLLDVAEVFNGKTPPRSEHRDSGHPVLKIRDVDEDGNFRGEFNSFVDGAFALKFKKKWAQKGDILILNAAHNVDYVGSKTYLATAAVVGALTTGEWLIVRAGEKLLPEYAFLWLTSFETRLRIKEIVKGIHLYPRDVENLSVTIPPLPEQRSLVNKFEQIRSLSALHTEAKQALTEALEALKREAFLE